MADDDFSSQYPDARPLTIFKKGGNSPVRIAGNGDWGVVSTKPLATTKGDIATDWTPVATKPIAGSAGSDDWGVQGQAPATKGAAVAPAVAPSSPVEAGTAPPATPPTASTGGSPLSLLDRIGERAKDFGRHYKEDVASSEGTMKSGWEDIKRGKYALGATKAAVGGVGYVGAPISAGIEGVVGDPTEAVTGSKKLRQLAEFAAGIMLPGPKGVKALEDSKAGQTVEKIVSPTTVSPIAGEAEASTRSAQGWAARDTARDIEALDTHTKLLRKMDEPARRDFLSYVEGSKSGPLPKEQQQFADTFRGAMQGVRRNMENLDRTAQMNFVENYFPHQWQDPQKAQQFFGGGKEGATGFTKGRKLPTIEDGIAAGLVPKTLDPIEAAATYISNANRFIATERTFEQARDLDTVKYYLPGKQPAGWTEVQGRLGAKDTPGGHMLAYAPEDWARVYNNFVSKGITGPTKSVYDTLQKSFNAITAMELGFSAYHARTMAKEAIASQATVALGELTAGRVGAAAKAYAKVPIAPVQTAMTGKKLEKVYLGTTPGSERMRDIADLLTEAGGRGKGGVTHTGGEYAFGKGSGFVRAWKRGTLWAETMADIKTIKGSPILGTMKVGAKSLGNVMTDIASPLFEKYIPRLKNGAFYEEMSSWLDHNPSASHEAQAASARQIWDSVDNRFGEVVKDNIFWNKTFKQISQLALRSYSWDLGTVREVGGGVKDIVSQKWTPRARYVISMPIMDAVGNAVYQALKTNEAPRDLMDLVAPRTGGKNPDDTDERAGVIGYMRDIYGWLDDPSTEAMNKFATGPRLAVETLRNKNWQDLPIAPPSDPSKTPTNNISSWLGPYIEHVANAFEPISVSQVFKTQPKSNIPLWERIMGTQAASSKYADPEKYEKNRLFYGNRDYQRRLKLEDKEKQKYGGMQ